MGVIYIGDRATGKTSLAMELAHPKTEYVKVTYPDYDVLRGMLFDLEEGTTRATDAVKSVYNEYLEVQVQLPTGAKEIALDWLDTPGEIWRQSWQSKNPQEWESFLETIRQSQGIVLVMPPYREIIRENIDLEGFITQQQWCKRFQRWVDFFKYDCPKIRHLVICLNKADLFCNLAQEASRLEYIPHRSQMNWQQRDAYVSQRYFRAVLPQIQELNRSISGLAVRCFITSIHNRKLLELPWIYLGTFLAT